MRRETATQWQDLPHVPRLLSQMRLIPGAPAKCECGRVLGDDLHGLNARELASLGSAPSTIITEKGV